jgi:hypothetical protein
MKSGSLIFIVFLLIGVFACKKEVTKNNNPTLISTINLTTEIDSIEVGKTIAVKYKLLPLESTDTSVTWSSSDTSIAKVINGLVTAIETGSVDISATANDGSGIKGMLKVKVYKILNNEIISAKWIVSGTSDYKSFEFNENGNYLVVAKSTDSQINRFGRYKITDNQTITLHNFGTLKLSSINGSKFDFKAYIQNSSTYEINVNTTKATENSNSSKTNQLCRTWKMISVNGDSSVSKDSEQLLLFSNAGTYFVSFSNPIDENEENVAQWKWKDNTEAYMCVSWNGEPTCDGSNEIQIIELTANTLKIQDKDELFVLKPIIESK